MIHCFGKKYQHSGISFVQDYEETKVSQEIQIYYLILGTAEVKVNDRLMEMKKDDLLLYNFEEEKYFKKNEDTTFVVRISLENELFYDNSNLFQPTFKCNSILDVKEEYLSFDKIKRSLNRLIEEAIKNHLENPFKVFEAAFSFLNYLIEIFLEDIKSKQDTQIQKYLTFIQENVRTDISLSKMANHFYINPSYLSRYFKKHQGIGFQEYLITYRLYLSEKELIYTDKNISSIALEVGFKNLNIFTKHFKNKYHFLPKEYREKKTRLSQERILENEQELQFLSNWLEKEMGNSEYSGETIDFSKKHKIFSLSKQLLNIGSASDLLHSDYRKQIRFLKKEINFTYGRIWNLFVEEMNVDIHRIKDINFDRIDSILDFLLEIEIVPFFELGYKIRRIYKNVNKSETRHLSLPSYDIVCEDWIELLTLFMKHVRKRYGIKEISAWKFELTRDGKDIDEYMIQYKATYKVLKNIDRKITIGGAGFKYNFDQISFQDELKIFEKEKLEFDFLSVMSYPYERKEKGQRYSKRINNPNFLREMIENIYSIKNKSNYSSLPLYLTEWGNTISNRNKINDTVYKGAHTIKSIIDIIDKVELIGYWLSSDLYSSFVDSKELLNGGNGILNKNGIPKASFFAIKFLSQLSTGILFYNHSFLVSKPNESKIEILIHNAKELNYRYFLTDENEITYSEIEEMFVEKEKCRVLIDLVNLPFQKYQMKISTINSQYGNLLKLWEQIGFGSELSREQINYLARLTTANLYFSSGNTKDLEISQILEANEFSLIEIELEDI
ncbi:MAG: GH39 family glycosyl hydrolase [Lactovum sp.]